MIQATGDTGTQWILDLCNGIVKEGSIPDDWKSSVVLPIYTENTEEARMEYKKSRKMQRGLFFSNGKETEGMHK